MAAAEEKDPSAAGVKAKLAPPVRSRRRTSASAAMRARRETTIRAHSADMNRAVELAPDNPEYRFQRALAPVDQRKARRCKEPISIAR